MLNKQVMDFIRRGEFHIGDGNYVSACCATTWGLQMAPKGLSFAIDSKEELEHPTVTDPVEHNGFVYWYDELHLSNGSTLYMKGVSSDDTPVEKRAEKDHSYSMRAEYFNTFAEKPTVYSVELNRLALLLENDLPGYDWNDKPTRLVFKEVIACCEEQFKDKYIITITKDTDKNNYQKLIDAWADKLVYTSPMFQNRRYAFDNNYLQCVIYKF